LVAGERCVEFRAYVVNARRRGTRRGGGVPDGEARGRCRNATRDLLISSNNIVSSSIFLFFFTIFFPPLQSRFVTFWPNKRASERQWVPFTSSPRAR